MAGEAKKQIPKEDLWNGGRSPFSVSYGKMMMWYFLVSDALTFSGLLVAYGASRHAVDSGAWPIGEQAFEALPFLGYGYPLIYVALMTFILIVSSVTMVLAVEAGHRNYKKGVVKWLGWTIIGGAFFVGSQGWEWYHFIHGSGGAFKITETIQVTGLDADDESHTVTIAANDWIYMDSDFGHEYEHALDQADIPHSTEAALHAHHGEGESHHGVDDLHPESLVLNKYTENTLFLSATEASKVWDLKESHTFKFGANMERNEYGPQQYANLFFFITGFHGFHVFSGVLINVIVWIMVIKGVFERRKHYEMVEKIGLYWHFVDLVWVFVFTFFYLV